MVVETCNGIFVDPCVMESELAIAGVAQGGEKILEESAGKQELDGPIKIVQENIFTLVLLNGANYQRHSEVRNALSDQFTQGSNTHPKTIEDDVWLLNNYKTMRVK